MEVLDTVSGTITRYDERLNDARANRPTPKWPGFDAELNRDHAASAQAMALLQHLVQERVERLSQENEQRTDAARTMTLLTYVSAFACFLLYACVFWLFRQHLRLNAETEINHEQLNEVFMRHPEGLLVVNDTGRITRSNPAACEILGYTTNELEVLTVDALVPLDARDTHAGWRHDYMQVGGYRRMAKGRPLTAIRKDGSAVDVEVSLNRIPTATGRATIVSCRDITEALRKSADLEDALKAAERASESKSQFLATMSHELRTPLNAIIGFSELLADGAINNQQTAGSYADYVAKAGRHLLSIVNDILDFAKVRNEELTFLKDPVLLHSIIDHAQSGFHQTAADKGVSLNLEQEPGLPTCILSDATRINQILFNLVGNAIKFTSKGRVTLRVSSEPLEGRMCMIAFTVQDTGPGIPKDRIDQIFDPFTQADPTITREFGGTGLGLAICKNLANAMGGDITVESEPGVGSTFTATIVAEDISGLQKAIQDANAQARQNDALNLKGRVLVVDDVEYNALTVKAFLEPTGVEVNWVDNAEDAIKAVSHEPFDLVLMDIHMPGMSGEDAASKMREIESAMERRVPIYAWTADALKKIDHGDGGLFDGVLIKPTLPDQVYRLVKQSLAVH